MSDAWRAQTHAAASAAKRTVTTPTTVEQEIEELVASCYHDPLKFVRIAYPWGEPDGPLKDEEGPDANQIEFLTALGDEVTARAFDGQTPVLPVLMAETSGHGTGKALAVSVEIPTPCGTRRFGDLVAGDRVFAEDGTPTQITNVFHQGPRQLFRVTFDDGSSVEADGDHLWKVRGRSERRRQLSTWRTLTTAELLAAGVKRANGVGRARQWQIPAQGAAQFCPHPVPVHPYTLGVWLGDGCRNGSRITSIDPEVIAQLREVGETVTRNHGDSWWLAMLEPKLRALGISGAYSYEKAVPRLYLENAIDVRADVLRGLLDTDGECDQQGSTTFNSTSRALAEDVVWLVRSLGGKATLRPTPKRPRYPGPDGVLKDGRLCWRVTIQMPPDFTTFYIARKQARVRPIEPRYLARWIDRIEPTRVEDAMCITIAHPAACYLANDFIVTHNSALGAWITDWILSTRPHSIGTVTAGTAMQLEERTWAAILYWTRLCLTAPWFDLQARGIFSKDFPSSWKVIAQTSKDQNAQSFAGQHAKTSTSWYLFDEASEIGDKIWETAYGGLTDGEPMMFVWGQPVRNSGAFYRVCFGSDAARWNHRRVDSRTSRFTNKDLIQLWIDDYGIDSDYIKVRILGLPPSASELQYIDKARVDQARKRTMVALKDDPIVAGFDVSGGGKAWNVIRFRQGLNGNVLPPIRMAGDKDPDRSARIALCAELLSDRRPGHQLAAMFVDSAFGAAIVTRLHALGHTNVHEINFGGESPDPHQLNMRAFIHCKARDYLLLGSIPDEDRLCEQLCLAGYHINTAGKLVIESKRDIQARGEQSPDDSDAFMLTFARAVAVPKAAAPRPPASRSTWG